MHSALTSTPQTGCIVTVPSHDGAPALTDEGTVPRSPTKKWQSSQPRLAGSKAQIPNCFVNTHFPGFRSFFLNDPMKEHYFGGVRADWLSRRGKKKKKKA